MQPLKYSWFYALCAVAVFGPQPAHAHFRLLKPTSWIMEGEQGDPQKMGPCGTSSGMPTNAVTQFRAGQTITVEWMETVAHPGYFRIAVVKDRSELKDPPMMIDGSCNYAEGSVPQTAPPVLADNLFPRSSEPMTQMFTRDVTLPNMPCEHCTLQVIQFMTNHPPPCIYYHCADISIVTGDGSGQLAGAGGDAAAAGTGGGTTATRAGAGRASAVAGASASPAMDNSGCSVKARGSAAASPRTWLLALIVLGGIFRRRRALRRAWHA